MFTPADINQALNVDPVTYERLGQRVFGTDTAGERSRLFVDLLDTDMTSNLDLDFILGFLEAKALIELGVFLLPPPASWPDSFPSTRPFIPSEEEEIMAARSDPAIEEAAANANAAQWQPPSRDVAKYFAASDASVEHWGELIELLQTESVTSLRRIGFVSSLPKRVWAAAGDVTFAANAGAGSGGPSASADAVRRRAEAAQASKARRHLLAMLDSQQEQNKGNGENADDDDEEAEEEEEEDEYAAELRELRKRKERFIAKLAQDKELILLRPQMLVGDTSEDATLLGGGAGAGGPPRRRSTLGSSTIDSEEGFSSSSLMLLSRPRKFSLDINITPVHLRIHGFSADPGQYYTIANSNSNASSASGMLSVMSGGGGMLGVDHKSMMILAGNSVDERRALVTLASMQRRSEVASRRGKLAEGSTVSMHAALDPVGGVLVDWHRASSSSSSAAANSQLRHRQQLDLPQQQQPEVNLTPSSSTVTPSGSLTAARSMRMMPQQSSSSSPPPHPPPQQSAAHSSAQLSVVSEDTEMWLALKGIVFRVPWRNPERSEKNKNANKQQQQQQNEQQQQQRPWTDSIFFLDEQQAEQQARVDEWSPMAAPTKRYDRAAEGRRLYYRTVVCPLQTGFDITTTFLTAPGRDLDPKKHNKGGATSAAADDDGEEPDDELLAELELMTDAEKISPLAQTKAGFRRPCRVHINRVFELFLFDFDVMGELVDCEQACNPWWF